MVDVLPITIRSGLSRGPHSCFVIAQIDELARSGAVDTEICFRSIDGEWSLQTLNWLAVRAAAIEEPRPITLVMGPDGLLCTLGTDGPKMEYIGRRPGQRGFGDLRDIRKIGSHVYVCGMSRRVYQRLAGGVWIPIDEGVRQESADLTIAGFSSIDGATDGDMWAVGFGGEIWRRCASHWTAFESPTNVVLHRIRLGADGSGVIAGQSGVVLVHRGGNWSPLEHSETEEDFWGVEFFDGRYYLATETGLFVLADGSTLKRVTLDTAVTRFGHLHAEGGALWSFGSKQLVWTSDGEHWHDATPKLRAASD